MKLAIYPMEHDGHVDIAAADCDHLPPSELAKVPEHAHFFTQQSEIADIAAEVARRMALAEKDAAGNVTLSTRELSAVFAMYAQAMQKSQRLDETSARSQYTNAAIIALAARAGCRLSMAVDGAGSAVVMVDVQGGPPRHGEGMLPHSSMPRTTDQSLVRSLGLAFLGFGEVREGRRPEPPSTMQNAPSSDRLQ